MKEILQHIPSQHHRFSYFYEVCKSIHKLIPKCINNLFKLNSWVTLTNDFTEMSLCILSAFAFVTVVLYEYATLSQETKNVL